MSTSTAVPALPERIMSMPYPQAKVAMRKLYVQETVAKHKGNISKTARETSLSRRTIHRVLVEGGS